MNFLTQNMYFAVISTQVIIIHFIFQINNFIETQSIASLHTMPNKKSRISGFFLLKNQNLFIN